MARKGGQCMRGMGMKSKKGAKRYQSLKTTKVPFSEVEVKENAVGDATRMSRLVCSRTYTSLSTAIFVGDEFVYCTASSLLAST
jgi:hypothetical protein